MSLAMVTTLANAGHAQDAAQPSFAPVIMILGNPEEGARLFTMIRLLPRDHPVAIGHDLPTLQTIHPYEVDVLVYLGQQVGLGLRATLERHKPPSISWPYYPECRLPPVEAIRATSVDRRAAGEVPVPGLRAVAFVDRAPVALLIDTRGLSLAARGMQRATTSGLDITRAAIEAALSGMADRLPPGPAVVTFAAPEE